MSCDACGCDIKADEPHAHQYMELMGDGWHDDRYQEAADDELVIEWTFCAACLMQVEQLGKAIAQERGGLTTQSGDASDPLKAYIRRREH